MLARYADDLTMAEARRIYFDVNKFGADGGYSAKWVDLKIGPIPVPFPNTASRVKAVRYHDLHHLLTGYDTDWRGEFEISAWEIAAGCKNFAAAWVLNLGGIAGGVFTSPVRTFRAFVRGLHDRTTYGEDYDTLLALTVGAARDRYIRRDTPHATLWDFIRFATAAKVGFLVGLLELVVFLPLAPFGVIALHALKPTAPD